VLNHGGKSKSAKSTRRSNGGSTVIPKVDIGSNRGIGEGCQGRLRNQRMIRRSLQNSRPLHTLESVNAEQTQQIVGTSSVIGEVIRTNHNTSANTAKIFVVVVHNLRRGLGVVIQQTIERNVE